MGNIRLYWWNKTQYKTNQCWNENVLFICHKLCLWDWKFMPSKPLIYTILEDLLGFHQVSKAFH